MRRIALFIFLAVATSAQAGTVYLCRGYDGSSFWTNTHCRERNALVDRMSTVRDGTWEQQLEEARAQRDGAASPSAPSFNRDQYCARLANERRQIESRYTNWQWQPPETINPDQQRTRAINSALAANHCTTQ